MKLKILATAVLATTTIGLSVARPGVAKTDLNAQLKQAVCSQNWNQAIQVVDQMKKVSGSEYASQLTMYRGRLEALANSGARVPSSELNCSAGNTVAITATAANNAPARSSDSRVPTNTKGAVIVSAINMRSGGNQYFRKKIVSGTVRNNTNELVTRVHVTYKVVNPITNYGGVEIGEDLIYSGDVQVNPKAIQPGGQGVFTAEIDEKTRGIVRVVSVDWDKADNFSALTP
jgi:hypothetical protein